MILVKAEYTPAQVKRAEAKRLEFRRNRYTSGVSHLDDLIALGKALILCDAHARRFDWKRARYRPHPDPKMRRVIGNCDVCKIPGLARLYLCGKDAEQQQRQYEKFKRALEYANFVAG